MFSDSQEGNVTGIGGYNDLRDFLEKNKLSNIYDKLTENDWTLELLAELDLEGDDIKDLVNELHLGLQSKAKLKKGIRKLQVSLQQINKNHIDTSSNNAIQFDTETSQGIALLEAKHELSQQTKSTLEKLQIGQTSLIAETKNKYLNIVDEITDSIIEYSTLLAKKQKELLINQYIPSLIEQHEEESTKVIGTTEAGDFVSHYNDSLKQIGELIDKEKQDKEMKSKSLNKSPLAGLRICSTNTKNNINEVLSNVKDMDPKLSETNIVTKKLKDMNTCLTDYENTLKEYLNNITGTKIKLNKNENNNENGKFSDDENVDNNDGNKDNDILSIMNNILKMYESIFNKKDFNKSSIDFYNNNKNEQGIFELKLKEEEQKVEEPQINNENENGNENNEQNNNNNENVGNENEGQQEQNPVQPPNPQQEQQPVQEPVQQPEQNQQPPQQQG